MYSGSGKQVEAKGERQENPERTEKF